MDDGPANYGTPTDGASPGSNALLAQPPLQPDTAATPADQTEGVFALHPGPEVAPPTPRDTNVRLSSRCPNGREYC